jgi:hypothetical protein
MKTLNRWTSFEKAGAANGSVLSLDVEGQRESSADCRYAVCGAVATRQAESNAP